MLLYNLLLALGWMAITGQVTPLNFIFGLVVGYLLLWIVRWNGDDATYFRRVVQIIRFTGYFLWQLLVANLRITYEILMPSHTMRPAVVSVPLDVNQPTAITLLANVITLTPGTLSLDITPNGKTLFVHAMYVQDADAFRREIKDGFERYIKEIFE